MILEALSLATACLLAAESREIGRSMPTISHSLVNLGKMEISFYLNGRDTPPQAEIPSQFSSPFHLPKSDPIFEEPCPCSSLRNMKDSIFGNPTGVLNKLLMNNDLFSNKEPVTSTLCCESHEHVEEGTVVFEFPPNQKAPRSNLPKVSPMPFMPFIFDNFAQKNSMLPQLKTKAIEIFLFPKKKEGGFDFSKLQQKKKEGYMKDGIQIVGDRDMKKSFVSVLTPPLPVQKDTTLKEQNEKEVAKEEINKNLEPANKLNAV